MSSQIQNAHASRDELRIIASAGKDICSVLHIVIHAIGLVETAMNWTARKSK